MGSTFSDEGQFEETGSRILVTGGTGLVGKGIQAAIRKDPEADDEVYIFLGSKDGDLRDKEATRAIFRKHRPTHVIHLAAMVGGLFANMRRKVDFFRENVIINDNVMECCREFHVKKLVSCLSTCVFPDKTSYPIDETMIHDGPPHESNEGYAYAKRLIDVMNRCYRDQYGLQFTSVVPTNVYGPHDNFSIEDGHVIPGLVHKAYLASQVTPEAAEDGAADGGDAGVLEIWGSGTPLRQFIHAEDLGRLTVWAMRHYDDMEPLILSVDESDEVSIADVSRLVAKEMGLPFDRIVFDTSKADGQFKKTANNAKLRQLLPTYQFKPMEEGVRETCAWFRRNYRTARK